MDAPRVNNTKAFVGIFLGSVLAGVLYVFIAGPVIVPIKTQINKI